MKILIYGAGAIGMTVGGFLSRRHEVTLLGRSRHMRPVKQRGIRIEGIWGNHVFTKCSAVTGLSRLAGDRSAFDLILLCVKSYDTSQAARDLRRFMASPCLIVSLQNGLGNVEALRQHLPADRILAGRVIFGAETPAPGTVRVTVIADSTALGEPGRRGCSRRVRELAEEWKRCGLPARATSRVNSLLWMKVIYNSALNPLASLLECPYGYLTEQELTVRMMDQVIDEIYAVASRASIPLSPPDPESYRRLFYRKLVPSTYHHYPSMLQDLKSGKRTEIDSLNGVVADMARRHSIPVPANRFLIKAVKEKEKRYLKKGLRR